MKTVVYSVICVAVWVLFCYGGKIFHIEQQDYTIMLYGFVAGICSSTMGLLFASVMK